MVDKVLHRIYRWENGHLSRLESPALHCLHALDVGVIWQIVAEQKVEVGVESAPGHFGAVLHLKRAGGGIARVGKQRFLVVLALAVEPLKVFPWQQNLAPHFKPVGPVARLQLQRHALDGYHIGRHIITVHAIAACHGTHQPPVLICHRNRCAVILHFSHYLHRLTPKAILGAAQEVLHLLDAVAVGQRLHGALVRHLLEALAQVAAHSLCGRIWVEKLRIGLFQILQFAHFGVKFLVGYGGLVQHIVVVVMPVEVVSQRLYSCFDIFHISKLCCSGPFFTA